MDAAGYLDLFLKSLPSGRAWPRHLGSKLSKLLMPFADDAARFDARWLELMEEADPRTTTELVATWEYVVGLPDTCAGPLSDIDERRAAIWQRLTGTGGQSADYFTEVAARLGYIVSIKTFSYPFVAGSLCGGRLYSEAWRFTWAVTVGAGTAPLLECVLSRLKPADTAVYFIYTGD